MTVDETLFDLLPAIHRVRDADSGNVLQGLLNVLESERARLDEDILQLYDNWFIETADEWVVPYIGDLLAVRGIRPIEAEGITQRGVVANTIRYRRRKGTAAVLEQLARDVSGWPARAVEFFELLATTQFMNHVRPANLVTTDLRDGLGLETIGTAFDRSAHLADVRHVDVARDRYNIPNVGLFLWRLQPYRVTRSVARPVPAATPAETGRFRFNPLGLDAPLFNLSRTEEDITHLALETDVPAPVRRRPLAAELRLRQAGELDDESGRDRYFGAPPILEVYVDGSDVAVPLDRLAVCDLSDPPTPLAEGWRRPPAASSVAIDPVLGRIALAAGMAATSVEVTYAYGFSGDLGGGPYGRQGSLASALSGRAAPTWQVGVTARATVAQLPDLVPDLAQAIAAWNAAPQRLGVIAIMDSRSYAQPLPQISIPADSTLVIVAADWPTDPDDELTRPPGRFVARQLRPHVAAPLSVVGTAPATAGDAGTLVLDGLLLEGSIHVLPGNLGRLRVAHSTLVPVGGADSLTVDAGALPGQGNDGLRVDLERTISGRLTLAAGAELRIIDSIVDGLAGATAGQAVVAGDVTIEASTIIGTSAVRSIHASNAIFTAALTVERRQTGCVRYSYAPIDSLVPRRFRCQPSDVAPVAPVAPRFTSLTFGQPGYGQLAADGPPEIGRMAEGEGEMGAFRFLAQPDRLTNIRTSLEEYLRLGLEAGVFLVT